MKKLLITGASGFLGWHLGQRAQAEWQVYSAYQHNLPHFGTPLRIDLTDSTALTDQFRTLRPDAVIHAAALSSPNACQEQPELSYQINVLASWQLATLCAETTIPLVFTSSEQVFDGRHPPYREGDRVCPVNRYGEHKVAAEVGILERYPQAAICRMPLMFGVAPAPSFIQPFIARLRSGQPLALFTDEIRNPLSGRDAAQGIFLALSQVQGYLHLGGLERLSRYEMGQLLVEMLAIEGAVIHPCRQADVPMPAPRPPDLSLDSAVAMGLGFAPRAMRQELQALFHPVA